MKTKIYSFIAILTLSLSAWSQGVGINETGSNPNPSAILDLESTTKGLLPPRMTSAQRNAIPNPPAGLMIYNTSVNCLQINDGSHSVPVWKCLSGAAGLEEGVISNLACSDATHSGLLMAAFNTLAANSVISYSGGNGGFYVGQMIASTGVTGLTAALAPGTFFDAVWNGDGTLNIKITGTPSGAGTASFELNLGGQTCTFTRTVVPFAVYNPCNPVKPTTINDVTNASTGKVWMDRNLGAERVATNSLDLQSYGSLYQWGRGSDAHQCVSRYQGDGVTTSSLSALNATVSSDTPGHGNFIFVSNPTNDWRSPQNNNLWQGASGVNNPCPNGYRLPTETELNAERISWTVAGPAGAIASSLKIPATNFRSIFGEIHPNSSTAGYYWSSTVNGTNARALQFFPPVGFNPNGSASMVSINRGNGYAVRCIKN